MLLQLPYQMLFAVATVDQVLVYSTAHQKPLALFSQLHFATINDLAWRGDRELELLACSSDGYISIMRLQIPALDPLPPDEYPEPLRPQAHQRTQICFEKLA